ncbi:MAG: hypothetical protein HOP15_10790, partial [Planctomycetes bacterium]|nr:hypothetical protein [Planctomycetota bacterium]
MPAALILWLWPLLGLQEHGAEALVRANALLEAGECEHALQVLEAELLARPDDPALQRALAQTLERFVDAGGSWLAMSDARDAWDRARALAPEDLEAQRGAIAVRLRLGEFEAALGLAQLEEKDAIYAARTGMAKRLIAGLKEFED